MRKAPTSVSPQAGKALEAELGEATGIVAIYGTLNVACAADESAFVTGAEHIIDGGLTAL